MVKLRSLLSVMLLAVPFVFGCSETSGSSAVHTATEAISRAKLAWRQTYEKAPWHEVYSPDSTARFEPYSATLVNDVWIVKRTIPAGYTGEVIESTVRQSDGSVSLNVVILK
jgi:hypothetical protein